MVHGIVTPFGSLSFIILIFLVSVLGKRIGNPMYPQKMLHNPMWKRTTHTHTEYSNKIGVVLAVVLSLQMAHRPIPLKNNNNQMDRIAMNKTYQHRCER